MFISGDSPTTILKKGKYGEDVLLNRNCYLQLTCWCESDWTSIPLTLRSLAWWIIHLGLSYFVEDKEVADDLSFLC